MDNTTLEFIKAARMTLRIELIVCAAMLMVVGTFVFDVSSATERSLHELARHQEFYDRSQPCNLFEQDVKSGLREARNRLREDELPLSHNVPLPPDENVRVKISRQPPSPDFPTIEDLMTNPEEPRCAAPQYDVLVRNHVLLKLAKTIEAVEQRVVLGRSATDLVVSYSLELDLQYQDDGFFVVDFTVIPPGDHQASEGRAEIGTISHRSVADWLGDRKYSKLEETFDLLGRPTVYGLVANQRVNEAAKTMKAVAHPEHKAVEVFGFGVPATVVGLAGPVILLGLSLLLLVYINRLRSDFSFDPHSIRRFPWFPFVAGTLPTILTVSALLTPLATILVILFTLGVPSSTTGARTLEQSLTMITCVVALVLIAVISFSLIEGLLRMRPSGDHFVDEARRKRGSRNALLELGAKLQQVRSRQGIDSKQLAAATDIPRPLLEDFERGASDLPVSYLLALAHELGTEVEIAARPPSE